MDGLNVMNFKEMTPVQEQAIPVIMDGKDVIACAQTGTGKTAAFLLPLLNKMLKEKHPEDAVNAIIMSPTRELAQQIDQQLEGFSYFLPISSVAVYGGNDAGAWDQQKRAMQLGADFVVATPGRLISHISLDNVDFSYNEEKQVLFDVSLYGNPGEKIAFVGSTGAGKTTITNLLNRFYDIQEGKIRYDGINIQKIKKPALRSALGMVLQDSQLFTGTIMENIRYGRLDATDEECITAARLANADAFIRRLPEGYDTYITGNGASLSQGERQMLCIARAAVADPPVMILDEATSSIDTRTESQVQKAMDALMHGRTTFVIAHRLSTVRDSDCIMVMEGGRIIERGSHDQLIAKRGRYYQLYTGSTAESA